MTDAAGGTGRRSGTGGRGLPGTSLAPRDGFVRANGIRLRYLDWAGPEVARRPPALLLHGVLQSSEGMANLASHLARKGRVVVPDLRGRGGSDKPEDGYDPATMADDVAGLIEALSLDRPVVIGRLHGGLVAYHLAARRPELVRGLVLGDTAPEVDPARAERALATIRALPARFASEDEALAFYQDRLGLSEARARHDLPHDLVPGDDGGLRWRHDRDVVERVEAASLPRSDWDVLARTACPTLLLRGQRGEVPRAMADRFCDAIAGCQVQTVLGARHDVFLGPGSEQAFGALDLFLMRLDEPGGAVQAPLADIAPVTGRDPDSQLPLPGAETALAAAESGLLDGAEAVLERVVRAINSRDPDAITALFAPDGRIVQHGVGGVVRAGGLDTARLAFERVLTAAPGATIEARDVLANGNRVACVFAVRSALNPDPADDTILAPAFLRVRGDQVAEFVSYSLRDE